MRNTLVSFCLLTTALWGQSFTGSIRGTVSDSTQAGVPNAKVIATDVDRKVEYPTQADSSGRYSFPSLPTASYVLTVEAPGFRKFTRPSFRLEVQQQATVDVALSVGDVATTVEVEASAPLLNATSATLGQVIEH